MSKPPFGVKVTIVGPAPRRRRRPAGGSSVSPAPKSTSGSADTSVES